MDAVLLMLPLWYFAAVPADLSYPLGALRAAGFSATARDLSMGFLHAQLAAEPAWKALRRPETYADLGLQRAAHEAVYRALAASPGARIADLGPRHLHLRDLDEGDVVAGRDAALDPARNPALAWLREQAAAVVALHPRLVGLALVHPDQRPQVAAFAALLRELGHVGQVVVYGAFEDVIAPLDLAPDLVGDPAHALFEHVDAVIAGESSDALVALLAGEPAPNALRRGDTALPALTQEDLGRQPAPAFDWIDPEIYPFPAPVIDLAFGRGCPYERCAFCAIAAHNPGYRFTSAEAVGQAMRDAHAAVGARCFRVRDPLVSPLHLTAIGEQVARLPFQARWAARARFSPPLTRGRLAAPGLGELWLGLESAVPRVRDLMDKGVSQEVVARVLTDAASLDLRLRALCLLGFPGETADEAQQTVDFLRREHHRLAGASLTPFLLMRRSPMAADPRRFGLILGRDPVPRHRRLRHTLPVVDAPGLGVVGAIRLKAQAARALAPLYGRTPGPWPSHAWIGEDVRRGLLRFG